VACVEKIFGGGVLGEGDSADKTEKARVFPTHLTLTQGGGLQGKGGAQGGGLTGKRTSVIWMATGKTIRVAPSSQKRPELAPLEQKSNGEKTCLKGVGGGGEST